MGLHAVHTIPVRDVGVSIAALARAVAKTLRLARRSTLRGRPLPTSLGRSTFRRLVELGKNWGSMSASRWTKEFAAPASGIET